MREWARAAWADAALLGATAAAYAGEGAGSMYLQGTYGDFQMGVFGAPGVYFRDDLLYDNASFGARPLDGKVALGVTQQNWVDVLKFAWLTDFTIFAARYGAAIGIPLILNAHVEGGAGAGGFGLFRVGDVSGLGDISISPIMLNWTFGDHHITFAPAIYAPTGGYDSDRLLNTGRNYWAYDVNGSYTWFDPKAGHEISLDAGVIFNQTNPATDYHTGTEFHLDWMLAQYFSASFGAGLTGYYDQQREGDSGNIAGVIDASNFIGEGVGLGPAVIFNVPIAGKSVSFIGKALFDVDPHDRFDGNLFVPSTAFKF